MKSHFKPNFRLKIVIILDHVGHVLPCFQDVERDITHCNMTFFNKKNIYHSSWCLIHNAHLRKTPSFCKILDLKITHLKKNFDEYFCLISATVIQGWHSRVKTITLLNKLVCLS
jgi:hypothetical protein